MGYVFRRGLQESKRSHSSLITLMSCVVSPACLQKKLLTSHIYWLHNSAGCSLVWAWVDRERECARECVCARVCACAWVCVCVSDTLQATEAASAWARHFSLPQQTFRGLLAFVQSAVSGKHLIHFLSSPRCCTECESVCARERQCEFVSAWEYLLS